MLIGSCPWSCPEENSFGKRLGVVKAHRKIYLSFIAYYQSSPIQKALEGHCLVYCLSSLDEIMFGSYSVLKNGSSKNENVLKTHSQGIQSK